MDNTVNTQHSDTAHEIDDARKLDDTRRGKMPVTNGGGSLGVACNMLPVGHVGTVAHLAVFRTPGGWVAAVMAPDGVTVLKSARGDNAHNAMWKLVIDD